ncbi:hypothetical protein KDH_43790 [Dictyobacter sp. S3.2.2.5]|uniref:DUF2335 domain-containing protein n=1 Tax=Dictyobacter halimunensis TaxID=3026934 RepID=A0ABQ6FWA6_9CHLR|nr:hypothetical protein KDH_43790 [Dictyobacter sp. S3.2.2.5]
MQGTTYSTGQWIQQNAIPLQTTDQGHSDADLAPLKQIVGNASIVGLGEETHGTHEIIDLKARLEEELFMSLPPNILNRLQIASGATILVLGTIIVYHLVSTQGFLWLWAAIPYCVLGFTSMGAGIFGVIYRKKKEP